MMLYGSYKRRNAEDRESSELLISMGRNWFLVATVLNFFAGPLVMFHFPAYGVEALFGSYYEALIVVTVLAMLYLGAALDGRACAAYTVHMAE